MRIAGIVRDSVVDGTGIRDVIFVQGCTHHCKGCHNPQTWDTDGGEQRFIGDIVEELSDSSNDITISGGEPLNQLASLLRLVKMIRKTSNKRIWMYTGYTMREPIPRFWRQLARYVDVVIDGKFVEEAKNTDLAFRGSTNQRIIDLPKSIEENKVVLWRG